MISAVILTKNEEKNIAECLQSLSWCDEILVIDDNSTDKTIALAKKLGATVLTHSLPHDFSAQRNFGLQKAKNEWVLFIDADERVSSALWYEIMASINEPQQLYTGFYFKRVDVIWGKTLSHGELSNLKLLRLAKKDAGRWEGSVHERWKITGKTTVLQNTLLHYPHQTVEEFLREINYYTDLQAKDLYSKKTRVSWWSIIVYPKAKFVVNYFCKAGFLDGMPGLVFALIMSFHSFLTRGKLWLLYQKK
jgi:glycosyltransferase involved in cell wall biosynthesis